MTIRTLKDALPPEIYGAMVTDKLKAKNADAPVAGLEPPVIRTGPELAKYIWEHYRVRIPNVKVCAHDPASDDRRRKHGTPWLAFSTAYFARNSVVVWEASRGLGGKSFLLSLLGLVEATTLKADVNILGGSGEQSKRVHGYMDTFWADPNAPREYLRSEPKALGTKLVWGNSIKALMASQRSVRGPHVPRLLMDEVDEMTLPILDAALGQTMDKPTPDGVIQQNTVLSSTMQYANGPMAEVKRRVATKGWTLVEWCYRENLEPNGWLTQAQVVKKRKDVTEAMWETEYELQEPNPGSRAIQEAAVLKMFDHRLGQYDGEASQYIEVEPPVAGATYAHGADWARTNDWTVIVTLRTDVRPVRLVAFERTGREDWPVMVEKFDKRVERYGGQSANDATGIGDVINQYMRTRSEAIWLAGKLRSDLLSKYISAIESGKIISPHIAYMRGEHQYASRGDVYASGQQFHLPDTICAGAMAWRAALVGGSIPNDDDIDQYAAGGLAAGMQAADAREPLAQDAPLMGNAGGPNLDDLAAYATGYGIGHGLPDAALPTAADPRLVEFMRRRMGR